MAKKPVIPEAKVVVTITLKVLDTHDVTIRFDSPKNFTDVDNIVAAISALAGVVAKHTEQTEAQVLEMIAGFSFNVDMGHTSS